MKLYVGNLASDVSDEDLQKFFESYGQVESANVIKDKFSGESRGFGFVEMPSKDEAAAAMQGADGKELNGRAIKVNEARSKAGGPGRRGGGPGGGFGGRRGGRGDSSRGRRRY